MLPIIRRIRRPLLPSDSPETAPVGQGGVPPASSGSVPAPSASTEPAHPEKIEKRSDFGQFRSDSIPGTPLDGRAGSPSASSPLGTLNPQHPWSLQPNEPPVDYQIFVAWLQLPAPRHLSKTAVSLGCSLHRLRQLSARHNWKTRAAAFDHHRANAASLALDQLVRDETSNWKERAQRFRLQEWQLHEDMLEAASDAIRQLRKHPARISLNDLVKLYDLSSILGRRACGMPLEPVVAAESRPPSSYLDFEAALRKVYGPVNSSKPAVSPEQIPRGVEVRK